RVIPSAFEEISNFSFPPKKITSFASCGILSKESVNLKLNRSAISSNCLKTQLFFCGPCGAKAPCLMESFGFGTNFFKFTSYNFPRPLHFGHIPFGELNEKLFGSGFGYEIPEVGHINERLKYLASFVSLSKTINTSSPWYIAVIMVSERRLLLSLSAETFSLSITVSISWVL